MRPRTLALVAIALGVGTVIGFIDSRPTWDDTGVTAGALLLAALVLGAIQPRTAWLSGFAVGVPVVLFNVVLHGAWGSVLALAISLVGAAMGLGLGRALGAGDSRHAA